MEIDLFGNIIEKDEEVTIPKLPRVSPWDYIKGIAKKEYPDPRDYHKEWWYVNSAYSMNEQTVLFANEMNKYHNLPAKAQLDFYYHGLPKKSFYSKYAKAMKSDYTKMIQEYFDVSFKVAKQYEMVLTEKQIQQIKEWYDKRKGGRSK